MPVLYAIFIYMGVAPLFELEFFHRILLIFMAKGSQSDLVFLRHVRLSRVHLFTFIQIFCLVGLFLFKINKSISITFPLMVLSLVFIRFGMSYIFTEKELTFLDDLIPGMNSQRKRRKSLNLRDIDTKIYEKARQDRAVGFSTNMNRLERNKSAPLLYRKY